MKAQPQRKFTLTFVKLLCQTCFKSQEAEDTPNYADWVVDNSAEVGNSLDSNKFGLFTRWVKRPNLVNAEINDIYRNLNSSTCGFSALTVWENELKSGDTKKSHEWAYERYFTVKTPPSRGRQVKPLKSDNMYSKRSFSCSNTNTFNGSAF